MDATQTDMYQLFNQDMAGVNDYDSAQVNNLLIPTGENTVGQNEVATFRDENMSLNGQLQRFD